MKRIAKLRTFKVSMLDFYLAKSMFHGYIFSRKDDTGYYLMADREQQEEMTKARIKFTEVEK